MQHWNEVQPLALKVNYCIKNNMRVWKEQGALKMEYRAENDLRSWNKMRVENVCVFKWDATLKQSSHIKKWHATLKGKSRVKRCCVNMECYINNEIELRNAV